ncbi:MAG: hypothetical protein MNSN_05780 [Minisyncoccus archaeiphilus]|jgi:prepilin-type N-terminal cleavage/methylation domain-containing protein|uniref:pilus assembly FimT family protein n=1 Tax=Minisyncoccus archaeiphilus TaxID=3238481 RepID=UPI0009C484C0|nr:MAG: hypothetical protein BWY21_01017 [Parcubacteria group bacterium ADurb.Bin216]GMX59576.1 MAG: hypothetical protein MNSN_05780 [Candidatus Parcubacteria bacterium]
MKGFTILELLLSVAMVAVLAGVAIPLYSIYYSRTSIGDSSALVVDSLRATRAMSIAGKYGSEWGVRLEQGKVTIFKGQAFSSRDQSYDQVIILEDNLNFTGLNDIYFNRAGTPNQIGNIAVSYGEDALVINVNEKGIIDY